MSVVLCRAGLRRDGVLIPLDALVRAATATPPEGVSNLRIEGDALVGDMEVPELTAGTIPAYFRGEIDGWHVLELPGPAVKPVCCVPGGAGVYCYKDGAFRCTTCGRVEEVVD